MPQQSQRTGQMEVRWRQRDRRKRNEKNAKSHLIIVGENEIKNIIIYDETDNHQCNLYDNNHHSSYTRQPGQANKFLPIGEQSHSQQFAAKIYSLIVDGQQLGDCRPSQGGPGLDWKTNLYLEGRGSGRRSADLWCAWLDGKRLVENRKCSWKSSKCLFKKRVGPRNDRILSDGYHADRRQVGPRQLGKFHRSPLMALTDSKATKISSIRENVVIIKLTIYFDSHAGKKLADHKVNVDNCKYFLKSKTSLVCK